MTDHTQALEEEKKTLMAELADLGSRDPKSKEWEAMPEVADDANADQNSQADRFEDFEEKTALIVPLQARLAQVDAALKKIKEGGYGVCRVCGKDIEEDRLAANPAAETCKEHLDN